MFALHVFVKVKPEAIDAFREASIENARATLAETGNLRFDIMQREEDPCEFIFVEAYREEADHAAHRTTSHFLKWREVVEPMMAGPRRAERFTGVYFPDAAG